MAGKRRSSAGRALVAGVLSALIVLLAGCGITDNFFPSPTPPATYSPTHTLASRPDLAIRSVSIENEDEDLCAPDPDALGVWVEVENAGTARAETFDVEVDGVRQFVASGLEMGESITLWFPGYGVETLVRVDASYSIVESDENNNNYRGHLPIPTLSAECQPTATPALTIQSAKFTMDAHTAKVWSVDFSPDGSLLASGSVDNTMRLWRVREGELLRTMRGHPFPVLDITFSPNGTLLATGSTDGLIRLWRVSDGAFQTTLEGHADWVTGVAFSPNGQQLASIAKDYTVRLWQLDGKLLQTVDEGLAMVGDLAFSPDGLLLAWTESDGSVRVWRVADGSWVHLFRESSQPGASIAFSPDGRFIAAGFEDGALRLWQVADGQLVLIQVAHTSTVSGLAFSPDGRYLVSGSWDGTLRLWQVQELEGESELELVPLLIYSGHRDRINCLAFAPQGDLIASGSDDGTVRVWEVPPLEP